MHVCVLSCLSRVWLFATPGTVVCQAHLSIGFSRQESWSGLPCPPPGDLPDPGIELTSLTSPAVNQKQMMSEWGIQTGGVRSLGNYNIGIGQLSELRGWRTMNASSSSLSVSRPFQRKWQLSWALKRWKGCLRLRDYGKGSRRENIPEAREDEVNWKSVRSAGLPRWLGSRFHLQRRRCRFDPWVRKIPGGGNGSPVQCSCLENPLDRRAWQATVHAVAKSRTRLQWLSTHAQTRGALWLEFTA